MKLKNKLGDCLEQLKTLESDSIDALITDPPAGISFMGKEWDSNKGGAKHWIAWMQEVMSECLRVMKPGAHGLVWAIPRTSHWTATACEQAGFEIRDVVTHLFGSGFPKSLNVGKKLQDYDGWGTALKPASEHWILIRKPLSEKTVAKNVERWGTGGINVDGSRVGNWTEFDKANMAVSSRGRPGMFGLGGNHGEALPTTQGRFPANLLFSHTLFCTDEKCEDGCPVAKLDEQSGEGRDTAHVRKRAGTDKGSGNALHSLKNHTDEFAGYTEVGGASRFFYCAKASKRERGADNKHPTVKPQKLMQYLIRLITPPNGIVLDPFMGSGSTGVAAKTLGFGFLGVERDAEYFAIAEKRIEAVI